MMIKSLPAAMKVIAVKVPGGQPFKIRREKYYVMIKLELIRCLQGPEISGNGDKCSGMDLRMERVG